MLYGLSEKVNPTACNVFCRWAVFLTDGAVFQYKER